MSDQREINEWPGDQSGDFGGSGSILEGQSLTGMIAQVLTVSVVVGLVVGFGMLLGW